jgi:ketosteroid isomerase-like protein
LGQLEKADVDRWLAAYVAAWKSYEPDQIGALFADDVEYRFHPYDEPVRGRDAVVESWLGESGIATASTRDEAGTYEATYRSVAVDGDLAVATGSTVYTAKPAGPADKVFDNCFVLRFDPSGRCCEFTEWYMERPEPARPEHG